MVQQGICQGVELVAMFGEKLLGTFCRSIEDLCDFFVDNLRSVLAANSMGFPTSNFSSSSEDAASGSGSLAPLSRIDLPKPLRIVSS